MKVNEITKYQAGGYIAYQPLPIIPQGQPAAAPQQMEGTDKKEDAPYLDKSTLNKMIGDGITTDVMAYSEQMNAAAEQYARMNDFQKNSYKGKQLRSMLKGDLGQLNALVRGKKTLDESINNAKSNNALEELAVTSDGMVVRDESTGKITTVSFAQFAADNNKKDKKFSALTNAQLAEEREFNKQLIGNSGVYSILNYGKGIDKVKEEVLKTVQNLGSSSRSVSNGSFEPSDREDVQQLIAAAKNGSFKTKSGQSESTNSPQIQKAKMAMWMNLSSNAKSVLRARAAQEVTSPGEIEKYAMTMAASLLDPMEDVSTSKMYDESLRAGAAGKGANGGNEPMTEFGAVQAAFNGRSNAVPLSQIGDAGVKIEGRAYALPPSVYTDSQNKRVSLQNAGGLNQIATLSQAFVGNGDKVRPQDTIITGDAYYTELPVKRGENGQMAIDEEGSKRWAAYQDELSRIPASQQTALKKSELKQKHGAQNLQTQKFVVAEAVSYDDSYSMWSNRDSKFYQDVDKSTRKYVEEALDPEQKTQGRSGFLGIDKAMHKHLVYIPAKDELSAREADGLHANISKGAVDIRTFNTGNNGANIAQGRTLQESVPQQFSADMWRNK